MRQLSGRFRFIDLDQMLALNETGIPPDEPVISICFDDGHAMFRTGAADVLKALGIQATLFVVSACIGNKHLMWMHALNAIIQLRGTDRLTESIHRVLERRNLNLEVPSPFALGYALAHWPMETKDEIVAEAFDESDMPPMSEFLDEHRPYADWSELADWISHGHSVGLHTRTHPFCSRLSADGIESEIIVPTGELKSRLEINRVAFAYPFGDRFPSPEIERDVCEKAGLSAMLGVAGLSRLGTQPWQIDRVDAERGLAIELFGRPMLRTAAGRA